MAAEYSANAEQIVPVGGSVVFTQSPVPCNRGLVYHRSESGIFRLVNRFFKNNLFNNCRRNANYLVSFHANIAVPEGETLPTAPEGISLSFYIDGAEDPSSRMISVPTAVETYDNVGAEIIVTVPYMCTCSSFSVVNTSTIPIAVQNANLVISA